MLFLKQGSVSALRISNWTPFHLVSPQILKKFVHPRFLCGTWDIQYLYWHSDYSGAPNVNFRKNTCSEDDLRSRIFGTFVIKLNLLLAFFS